jgi:cell division protease FtsH
VFLGREIGEQRNYSDEIAKTIDEEVRAIVDKAYDRATQVLEVHRDRLDALATKLIAEETVDHEAFETLFSDLPPKEDLHGLPPRRHRPEGEPSEAPAPAAKPGAKPKSSPAPHPA